MVIVVLAACEDATYHSQIGRVEGPDSIAEPAAHGQARWRTLHAGTSTLRALTCSGDGALAVGDRGTIVRIAPAGGRDRDAGAGQAPLLTRAQAGDGRAGGSRGGPAWGPAFEAPLPIDLHAVTIGPRGPIVGGAGSLFERAADRDWTPIALPEAHAHARSIAAVGQDMLVVGGVLELPTGSVGWAAERSSAGWKERRLDFAPAVFQVLPTRKGAILLILDSTPLVWSHRELLVQLLPAQDVHPHILAMAETSRGFVAAGIDTAWTIENGHLLRELRQLQMRMTAVTWVPPFGAVAVGRVSPPGGRAGGVAWFRQPDGSWVRELLVPEEALIAVARCGSRVFAAGERGLVAIRE